MSSDNILRFIVFILYLDFWHTLRWRWGSSSHPDIGLYNNSAFFKSWWRSSIYRGLWQISVKIEHRFRSADATKSLNWLVDGLKFFILMSAFSIVFESNRFTSYTWRAPFPHEFLAWCLKCADANRLSSFDWSPDHFSLFMFEKDVI
jgi:hypothetical protein